MSACSSPQEYQADVFSTEISPSVFGTLTIALPSSHEGGDAVVRYLDREKVLSTSKCAMTSAFWYVLSS